MRLTRKVNDQQLKDAKELGEPFVPEYKENDYCELEGTCDRDRLNKLGQLEDIEEELGIDLITLFKALKNGVYYNLNSGQADKVNDVSLNYCVSTGYFIHFEYLSYDICLDAKDYGKTWALTKEELL